MGFCGTLTDSAVTDIKDVYLYELALKGMIYIIRNIESE